MFILIDNYDSFTYNLVQYFGQLGSVPTVYRNDALTIDELRELHPTRLVISPGPCTPDEAGISCTAIAEFAGKIPIFGVCLGHQCIGQVFGAHIVRAEELMHGENIRNISRWKRGLCRSPKSFSGDPLSLFGNRPTFFNLFSTFFCALLPMM